MLLDRLLRNISSGKNKQPERAPLREAVQTPPACEEPAQEKTEPDSMSRLATLTKREHALLLLLLEGCTLKEAAGRLTIKYSTANTHMTSLYKKLGVSTRAELLIRYLGTQKQAI